MRKGGKVGFNKNGTSLDIWIDVNGKCKWYGVSIKELTNFLDDSNQKKTELYCEYDDDNPYYIPPMREGYKGRNKTIKIKCNKCKGTGIYYSNPMNVSVYDDNKCPKCSGVGYFEGEIIEVETNELPKNAEISEV